MAIMNSNNPPRPGSGYKIGRDGVVRREVKTNADAMRAVLSPRQVRKQVRKARRDQKAQLAAMSKGLPPGLIGVDPGASEGDQTVVGVYRP